MLILSRKKDESILIGENIKITIIESKHNIVKLGIDAPKELTILREELVYEVEQENKKAVEINLDILEQLPILLEESKEKET